MVIILAKALNFFFRFFGECVAQVLQGYLFAVADDVIEYEIEAIANAIENGKWKDGNKIKKWDRDVINYGLHGSESKLIIENNIDLGEVFSQVKDKGFKGFIFYKLEEGEVVRRPVGFEDHDLCIS